MRHNIDIKDLRSFLEARVFNNQTIRLKKINRGGCSYNYFAQMANQTFVVKLLFAQDGRLHNILKFLQNYPDFDTAHLSSYDQIGLFYNEYEVLVLKHVQGKKIKYFELTPSIVPLIVANYKNFRKIDFNKADFILEPKNPEELYAQNRLLLQPLLYHRSVYKRYIAHRLFELNERIYHKIPTLDRSLEVIHGDASLNNMLFAPKNKIAFLDLELIRYGHSVEDAVELILSALLSHFILRAPQKRLISLMNAFNLEASFSTAEWQYGICVHYLLYILRRLRGNKLFRSYRKDWLCMQYLKKFETVWNLPQKLS